MDELFDFLIKKDVEYKVQEPLSQYTSVRIGGPAALVAIPNSTEKLISLVTHLREQGIKHRVVGRMTNVLPSDKAYDGVVVLTKRVDRYLFDGTTVSAECGVSVSSLILRAAKLGLDGLTELYGIPGSLGGMVVSNAGAYGREIGDVIKRVRAYSFTDNSALTLDRSELGLSYRKSIFLGSNMIILSVDLELAVSEYDIIIEKLGMIKQRRAQSQPLEFPSLGSIFKKVDGVSAAQIIDQCGLKGLRIGGAEVSRKHAGFIVNVDGATASDFCQLIETVEREVYKQRAIILEREIELL